MKVTLRSTITGKETALTLNPPMSLSGMWTVPLTRFDAATRRLFGHGAPVTWRANHVEIDGYHVSRMATGKAYVWQNERNEA